MTPIGVIERTSILGREKKRYVIRSGEVREYKAWGGKVTVKGTPEGDYVVHDWVLGGDTKLLKDGNRDVFNPRFFHPPTILVGIGKKSVRRKTGVKNVFNNLLPNEASANTP